MKSSKSKPNPIVNNKPDADADAELLAGLGYKQEFKREFSLIEIAAVAFNIVGVAPSIFVTLVYALPSGGPISILWGWTVACFFIVIVGLALGDLASAIPTSGGLYYWTFKLSSPKYRRILSWLVGYMNSLSTTSAVASINWGCSQMILSAISISNPAYTPKDTHTFGLFFGIMLLNAITTSIGTKILARLQTVYLVVCISVALAVIVALPISTPSKFQNNASFALKGWYNETGWSNPGAFILSFLMPAWTVASFDSCIHLSEEASNASFAVPFGMFVATSSASVLGLGVLMAISFNMGTDLATLSSSDQPAAEILMNSLGIKGFEILWAFGILCTYFMGQSMSLASSRQIFAFSRDGALPFSGWIYRINSYTTTPVNAVWYSSLISVLLGMLGLAGTASASAIFSLSVIGASFAYGIPISAHLYNLTFLSKSDYSKIFTPGIWFSGRNKSKLISAIALLWLIFISIILCFPAYTSPTPQDMNYSSAVFIAVSVFSLVWYYFPKWGGVYWFEGPRSNLEGFERDGEGEGEGEGRLERGSESENGNGNGNGNGKGRQDENKKFDRKIKVDNKNDSGQTVEVIDYQA